jgi:hypothetical protein
MPGNAKQIGDEIDECPIGRAIDRRCTEPHEQGSRPGARNARPARPGHHAHRKHGALHAIHQPDRLRSFFNQGVKSRLDRPGNQACPVERRSSFTVVAGAGAASP